MFLSCLLIDTGTNPDRPRPGRMWLRNFYRVHQRLCMAFPSAARKSGDPEFLVPYTPDDFPEQRHLAVKKKGEVEIAVLRQVHSPRKEDSGFLFRIDPQAGGRAVIIVQSALEPDWDYAFQNARFLLAGPPQAKPFTPQFSREQIFRFRLVANPTRRLSKHSREQDGNPVQNWANEKGKGKRIPVPDDCLFEWLARRAESAGFCASQDSTVIQPGYVYVSKNGNGQGNRLRSARYEGVLTVTDAEKFRDAVLRGIGSGKAFGFGLLSVAPCAT